MQVNTLSKALTSVLLATVATSSMAATGSLTENAGNKLTQVTDSIYTSLTGKTVNDVVVNPPVTLFDYKEADSSYEDAYVNGSLNINDSKDTKTSYDLKLGLDYEKVMSGPDANVKYEAGLNGQVSKSGEDDAERTENYQGHASANYDKYFNPQASNAFWYGKGEIAIQQKQGDDYAGLKHPAVGVTGGLGYGRVVNVTPMARAMRVIEALIKNGNLSRVPSAATYQRIAQVVAKEDEYRKKYSEKRYAQYWINDIEKALGANVGPAGTIRIYEVLNDEKISTRKYGWDVRAGVGATLSDYNGKSGNPLLELQGNYYYPISNRTQFSNEARINAVLDDDDDSYTFTNEMGLTYELTDRVDWENTWNLSYVNNENLPDVTSNTLSSSFLYELSNSLDYEATVKLSHVDEEDAESTFDKGLYMGVKYRLK